MKTKYIAPVMEVVEMKVSQILTTSLQTGSTPTPPSSSDAPSLDIPSSVFDI